VLINSNERLVSAESKTAVATSIRNAMPTPTFDLDRTTIAARRDLRISRRTERGESFHFVEDPLRGKFFRLGDAEHALFAALDGRRTLAEALTISAKSTPNPLTLDEAVCLADWLVSAGLATVEGGGARNVAKPCESSPVRVVAGWNLWAFRVSLGCPDGWLAALDPLGRLVFGRASAIAWLVALVWSLSYVATHWATLVAGAPIVWGPRGVLMFGLAWCGLKAWHELGHALACRRFGGNVGQVGLAFILGMPSPFVDVSSIRRSPSKWERIIVSLAGVYCELFAAGIALVVHATSHDPAVRQAAIAVAMVAGIGPLVLNLNPLMRFDGYFALSDFMEVPNLAAAGKEEAGRVWRRFVLGLDEPALSGERARPSWIAWYGVAAAIWRVFVSASMVLLAAAKFGMFVTVIASIPLVAAWMVRRGSRCKTIPASAPPRPRNRKRQFASACAVALFATGLFAWCDPCAKELQAVVDYDPPAVVRTETAGFVRRVCVVAGEHVSAGTVVAELENDELRAEIARAESAVEQSHIRSRIYRQAGATAKEQTERMQRQSLDAELADLKRRRDGLLIVAPASGTVVSERPEQLVGRWLEKGSEVVVLGDDAAKVVHVAVPQRLVAAVDKLGDREASLVVAGRRKPLAVRLTTCKPSASNRLIHSAFSSEHGGATLVRRREATPEEDGAAYGSPDRAVTIAETLEPCFTMKAAADDGGLGDLAAGRTGVVRVRLPWRTVCGDVYSRAAGWLRDPSRE
jgi:putative peptide zinc metalloprotease protein